MNQSDVLIPTNVKDLELVIKRRRQIVRAAMKLFARKGFFKASMRDIAKQSGISLGAIYNYVRNKEEILVLNQAFFQESAGEKLKSAIQYMRDPLEKLRRLIRAELQLMDQYADYHLLVTITRQSIQERYSNSILKIERKRLQVFDEVLQECIEAGQIKSCNIPLTTKFIKVLIDSWINKQWIVDNADIVEVESAIFDLLLNGMSLDRKTASGKMTELPSTKTGDIMIISETTSLTHAIVSHFMEKGANVMLASDSFSSASATLSRITDGPESERLRTMIRDADVLIQDLGIGTVQLPKSSASRTELGRRLDDNLRIAQEMAVIIQEEKEKRPGGRLIYLAPWYWDIFANPVHFAVAREAIVSLTKLMAEKLAPYACNVNCINPGYIRSTDQASIEAKMVKEAMSEIPSGNLGTVNDVLSAISFLVSDDSSYATGSVLNLTGGSGLYSMSVLS